MAILLVPETAVDVAALQQFLVLPDIVHFAALEHQDRVGGHQRGQSMRDDDHGAAVGDALDIGVDDRFAFRVERAGRFIENRECEDR